MLSQPSKKASMCSFVRLWVVLSKCNAGRNIYVWYAPCADLTMHTIDRILCPYIQVMTYLNDLARRPFCRSLRTHFCLSVTSSSLASDSPCKPSESTTASSNCVAARVGWLISTSSQSELCLSGEERSEQTVVENLASIDKARIPMIRSVIESVLRRECITDSSSVSHTGRDAERIEIKLLYRS